MTRGLRGGFERDMVLRSFVGRCLYCIVLYCHEHLEAKQLQVTTLLDFAFLITTQRKVEVEVEVEVNVPNPKLSTYPIRPILANTATSTTFSVKSS